MEVPFPSSATVARCCARGSGVCLSLGWRLLVFFALGLALDFAGAVACCRWSFPADSFAYHTITNAQNQAVGFTWMYDRCELLPEYAEEVRPADLSNHQSPRSARWDVVRRSPVHSWWRDRVLWLDHVVTGEPLQGGVGSIRFGWPRRSWEAWWVNDATINLDGTARMARAVLALSVGGTIQTTYGPVPRAFPVALRPGAASINAAIYGSFLAAGWFAMCRWRRARALRQRGRCSSCGYDLFGLRPGAVCPECGATATSRATGILRPAGQATPTKTGPPSRAGESGRAG